MAMRMMARARPPTDAPIPPRTAPSTDMPAPTRTTVAASFTIEYALSNVVCNQYDRMPMRVPQNMA